MASKGALEFDEVKEPRRVPDGGSTGWLLSADLAALFLLRAFSAGRATSSMRKG
jgi:hypothetical protein